MNSLYLYYMTY